MIELIDLSNWKKMREIKLELHREYGINISRDGREFRHAKEKWNKEFCEGNRPYYITHSNKNGYKAVTDIKEAEEGLVDLISRSRKMENEVTENRPKPTNSNRLRNLRPRTETSGTRIYNRCRLCCRVCCGCQGGLILHPSWTYPWNKLQPF